MAELVTYPTDQAICRLLAGEALPTAAIADRLALPDRTARHRLTRLRRAGLVVTGPDGLHRLAAGLSLALAEPVPALAEPARALAATTESDGPAQSDGGRLTLGTVLVGAAVGLAVAGAIAAAVKIRRMPPAPLPAPPSPPPAWPSSVGRPLEGFGWSSW